MSASEPIAEERIEWGHRLAADFPGRERFHDANRVHPCMDWATRAPCTEPCGDNPTINGYPQDHVWRRVVITEWQEGQP